LYEWLGWLALHNTVGNQTARSRAGGLRQRYGIALEVGTVTQMLPIEYPNCVRAVPLRRS